MRDLQVYLIQDVSVALTRVLLLGVLLSEIAEQEDQYAQNLEESRSVLKSIRNTERSVQPSRDNKSKITDEIAKLK